MHLLKVSAFGCILNCLRLICYCKKLNNQTIRKINIKYAGVTGEVKSTGEVGNRARG